MFDDLYFADRTNGSRIQDHVYIYSEEEYMGINRTKSDITPWNFQFNYKKGYNLG